MWNPGRLCGVHIMPPIMSINKVRFTGDEGDSHHVQNYGSFSNNNVV